MPNFTLHRNYTLRSLYGRSIEFKKGEKTWVPPECVNEAIAIGCVPEEAIDILPPEEVPPVVISFDERKAKIVAAFDTMLERNERTDFTATGLPNTFKLEKLCGFEVHSKERDELWMEYSAAKVAAQ